LLRTRGLIAKQPPILNDPTPARSKDDFLSVEYPSEIYPITGIGMQFRLSTKQKSSFVKGAPVAHLFFGNCPLLPETGENKRIPADVSRDSLF